MFLFYKTCLLDERSSLLLSLPFYFCAVLDSLSVHGKLPTRNAPPFAVAPKIIKQKKWSRRGSNSRPWRY